MSVTIIVGGQYGSEGKGKVVALEARRLHEPYVVRCGGPNSGHSVVMNKRTVVLRQIPAGVVNPNALLLLAPGCAVDPEILAQEVKLLSLARDRVIVDPRAVVVTQRDREAEAEWADAIGSTASGTGAALIRRMQRAQRAILADSSELIRSLACVESVSGIVQRHLDQRGEVLVEGTQGFGLSLLHGEYPYVTSRDTTAAGFASESGIAPHQVTRVLMVLRTFPIRVGGDSGPMAGEISWADVQRAGGAPEMVPEYTSVTKKLRRVATFDWDLTRRATLINRPTSLAVMGLDRLDYRNTAVSRLENITDSGREFLNHLQTALQTPVEWVGTGFEDQAFRVGEE